MKTKFLSKGTENIPTRRVWVVKATHVAVPTSTEEPFGYNDWDIYHGA